MADKGDSVPKITKAVLYAGEGDLIDFVDGSKVISIMNGLRYYFFNGVAHRDCSFLFNVRFH